MRREHELIEIVIEQLRDTHRSIDQEIEYLFTLVGAERMMCKTLKMRSLDFTNLTEIYWRWSLRCLSQTMKVSQCGKMSTASNTP